MEEVVTPITNDPFLDPLDPLSHITNHRPADETAKNVDDWYETEQLELNFGDENGRPSKDVQARREMLDSLFREGWYVTAVKNSVEGGDWTRVVNQSQTETRTGASSGTSQSKSESSSTNNTHSQSTADSESTNNSSSDATSSSNSKSEAGYDTWMGRDKTTSESSGASTSTSDAQATTTSNGTQTGTSTEKANGTGSEEYSDQESSVSDSESTSEESAPYYYAYSVILLERRRMQSNRVLKTMVDTLVARFNEGKKINLDRYDEIVALYALMLNRTETEGNKLIDDGIDFTTLFDGIKTMVEEALESVDTAHDDDWKAARIAEINEKFDAIKGQILAKLVNEGRYNTTVYTSEISGNERERQYALNKVKDDIINVELRIAEMKTNIGNNLIAAQTRIFEALQKKRIDPINLRNTVFKWMLDFMERRTDEYPELSEMQTVAERLGYAGGIAYPTTAKENT